MKITFAEDGWGEYLYWQTQDKKDSKEDKSIITKYRMRRCIAGHRKAGTVKIRKVRKSNKIKEEITLSTLFKITKG